MVDAVQLGQRIKDSDFQDQEALDQLRELSGGQLPRVVEHEANRRRNRNVVESVREQQDQEDFITSVDVGAGPFDDPIDSSHRDLNDFSEPLVPNITPKNSMAAKHLAATASFLTGDEDEIIQTYQTVRHQLETTGESPLVLDATRGYLDQLQDEAIEIARDVAVDPDIPEQSKIQIINQLVADQADRSAIEVKLTDFLRERAAERARPNDPQSVEGQVNIIDGLSDQHWASKEWFQVTGSLEGLSEAWLDQAIDIIQVTLTPGFALQYRKVHEAMFPGTSNILHGLAGGEMLKKTTDLLMELPPEERIKRLEIAKNAINENKFWGINNDVMKFFMMEEMFPDPLINLSETQWRRVLINVFSFLDSIGFLTAARGAARIPLAMRAKYAAAMRARVTKRQTRELADRLQISEEYARLLAENRASRILMRVENVEGDIPKNNPAVIIANSNPEAGRKIYNSILDDETGEIADSLNIDRDLLSYQTILPKPFIHDVTGHLSLNDRVLRAEGSTGVRKAKERVSGAVRSTISRKEELDLAETTFQYNPFGAALHKAEKAAVQSRYQARIDLILEDANVIQLNKSQITPLADGSGFHTSLIVSRTMDRGWNLAIDAKRAAQRFTEVSEQGMSFRVLGKHPQTGKYVTEDEIKEFYKAKKKAPKTDWIIQMEFKHIYNVEDALEENLIAPNAFIRNDGLSGPVAKYTPGTGYLAEDLLRAGRIGIDMEASYRKAFSSISRPLKALKPKQQHAISKVLQEDVGQREWRSYAELRDRWSRRADADQLILGYDSYRIAAEAIHTLQDMRLARQLRSEGQKVLRFKKGVPEGQSADNRLIGRFIDDVPRNADGTVARRVWDPDAGELVEMSLDKANALVREGHKFVRLRTPMSISSKRNNVFDEISYVIHRYDTPNLKVSDVPETGVLRRVPSYVPGIHDSPWLVVKPIKVRENGGREITKEIPLYSARTKGEANDIALRNTGPDPESGLKIIRGREHSDMMEWANQQSLDSFMDTGRLFTSPKSSRGLPGIDGRANLAGPLEAMEMAVEKTARDGTLTPILNKLTANWEKTYGTRFGIYDQKLGRNRMPLLDDIPKPRDPELIADWRNAIAMRDHIVTLMGGSEPAIRRLWNTGVDWIADTMSLAFTSRPMRELAAGTRKTLRGRDPMTVGKISAFIRYIAANPLRQALLQFNQNSIYAAMEGGREYAASGRAARDYFGLASGVMMRNTPAWESTYRTVANRMGMSPEEYKDYVDAYIRSGLPIVDSHTYATAMSIPSELIRTTSEPGILRTAGYYGNKGMRNFFRFLRKIGFDAGEQAHLLNSYNFSINRWKKLNPKKADKWMEPENLQEIVSFARGSALDMTKAGAMAFQRGTMGLLFQFFSHTTKAATMLLPTSRFYGIPLPGTYRKSPFGKLSNKEWTDKEKDRLRTHQFLLYGTGGFGMTAAWQQAAMHAGIEVPNALEIPGTNMTVDVGLLVEEAILGTVLNLWLRAGDEDIQSRVVFSESFGPFAGTGGAFPVLGDTASNPLAKIVESVVLSARESQFVITVDPPALKTGTDMWKAWKFTTTLMGWGDFEDIEELEDSNKAALILDEWARLLPFYNNFVKARAGMKAGHVLSNNGHELVSASAGELWTQAWLGNPTSRQKELGSLLGELTGRRAVTDEGITSKLDNTARDYYNILMNVTRRTSPEAEVDPERVLKIQQDIERNVNFLRNVLTEDEFAYVSERVVDLAYQDMEDNMETRLVNQIISLFNRGGLPESYITRIKNLPEFPQKQELIDLLEDGLSFERPVIENED